MGARPEADVITQRLQPAYESGMTEGKHIGGTALISYLSIEQGLQ